MPRVRKRPFSNTGAPGKLMPLGKRLFGDPFVCPFFGGTLRPLTRKGIAYAVQARPSGFIRPCDRVTACPLSISTSENRAATQIGT